MKCYGRYGDLDQQYEVFRSWMLNDVLTSYSDFPTDQTFHKFHDFNTELDLHRITSCVLQHLQQCGMPEMNAYLSGYLVPHLFGTCLPELAMCFFSTFHHFCLPGVGMCIEWTCFSITKNKNSRYYFIIMKKWTISIKIVSKHCFVT